MFFSRIIVPCFNGSSLRICRNKIAQKVEKKMLGVSWLDRKCLNEPTNYTDSKNNRLLAEWIASQLRGPEVKSCVALWIVGPACWEENRNDLEVVPAASIVTVGVCSELCPRIRTNSTTTLFEEVVDQIASGTFFILASIGFTLFLKLTFPDQRQYWGIFLNKKYLDQGTVLQVILYDPKCLLFDIL